MDDPIFQKYLTCEIKTLLTCNNENIVKYNGAFFEEGSVNLILEYMDIGKKKKSYRLINYYQ